MPEFFSNWDDAASHSTMEKAVSFPFVIVYHGKPLEVEIIKPIRGDGWMVQAGSGYKLYDRRPTTAEIDAVKHWKRW